MIENFADKTTPQMTDEFIEIEHPGIMLKEDFLDDLDIKPGTFARAIGVDRTAIKNMAPIK
ncbi:MAG: plasmid maintenance system antidote protein VapI [Phenylobacterium sp.]|jgi:plasmid maintenance system antidote protein VapI